MASQRVLRSSLTRSVPRGQWAMWKRSLSAEAKVRQIVIEEEAETTTVFGRVHPGEGKRLRALVDSNSCPICRHNIHITMEDVLILRQFLDHNNRLIPQETTGVCDSQQEKLEEAVRLAQANNLLPRPEDFQMPYRFSERVSMKDVAINFLPHREEPEVLVKGRFGLDHYSD